MRTSEPTQTMIFDERAWRLLRLRLKMSLRELQISRGVFDDQKEATIAAELAMSPHTVRTHMERLYHKLGVCSRVGLVVRLVEQYLSLTREPGSVLPPLCGERTAGRCPLRN